MREIPFLILPGAEMERRLAAGENVTQSVFQGMEALLGPRIKLYDDLMARRIAEAPEWVEPIGIRTLLRTFSLGKLSGYLLLRAGKQRNAEVIFDRGEMCGITVNAPQPAVGPMAMLHLLGFEWKEYFFIRDYKAHGGVSLGDLESLVETACRQNNALLSRVYENGTRRNDVSLNYSAMEGFMHTLTLKTRELFISLGEGEPAAFMAAEQVAPPAVLRSLLFDMRRRAVILPNNMKAARLEEAKAVNKSVAPPPTALRQPAPGPAPLQAAPQAPAQRRRGTRWGVVVITTSLTIILATAGYFVVQAIF